MNVKTKITLSAKELELVCNTEWILTKQIIIQKVYDLFGQAAAAMQEIILSTDSSAWESQPPKISKGENYQGLPYVMLDYPRVFGKEDIAAIRTFFWWGNFCSVSLLLAGKYKTAAEEYIMQQCSFLSAENYFICTNESLWEHHFAQDNYAEIGTVNPDEFTAIVKGKPFVKIAKKIPLQQWEQMPLFIVKSFIELACFFKLPGGEKDL